MEEHPRSEHPDAHARRSLRTGARAAAVLLLGVAILWGRYVCTLPPYTMARPALPQPNAFDFTLYAADALRTVPGNDATRSRTVSTDHIAYVLEECAPALQTFRTGLKHPFVTPIPPDALINRFEYLRGFRALAATLAGQSRVAAEMDDVGSALDSIAEILRFGALVPRGGLLDHVEGGCAIEHLGLAELAVLGAELDAPQCRQALRRLSEAERRKPALQEAISRERDLAHELLSGIARRDAGAFALLDRVLRWRWSGTPRIVYLWNLRGTLRELEQATAEATRQSTLPAGRRTPLPATRHPLLDRLRTAGRLERALENGAIRGARYRLLQVDLALRAYRLEHGHSPAALADLVPAYLPAIPQDPFGSGEALRYIREPAPLAYSVGPDRADDGGRRLIRWRRLSTPYQAPRGDLATGLGQYDLWRPS